MQMLKLYTLFFSFFCVLSSAQSELKFNLATSLVLVPNIGIEIEINKKIDYQLDTSASFWDSIDGSPYQFVQIFNELRYYPKLKEIVVFLLDHTLDTECLPVKNPKFLTDKHFIEKNRKLSIW